MRRSARRCRRRRGRGSSATERWRPRRTRRPAAPTCRSRSRCPRRCSSLRRSGPCMQRTPARGRAGVRVLHVETLPAEIRAVDRSRSPSRHHEVVRAEHGPDGRRHAKSAPYSRWTGPVAVICAWEFTTTFGGQRPNGPAGDGGDGYWVPGSANTYSRPLTLAGKLSSALPMYSLPFTTVGDELTRTFFVCPRQIWEHEGCPHGPAFQARTSEV